MKSKHLLLTLLMALLVPWAAQAQSTLTVHDGTATSTYVPIYGNWADAYLKCEYIMPAAELADMNGESILNMTWYLSSPASAAWTGTFQIFMKEVEETEISAYQGTEGATIVYEGTLDGSSSTLLVEFTNTYAYNGRNLLIGVYQTAKGNYKSCTFSGETVEGACVQGYSSSSLDGVTATQRNFIPKTTFSYGAPPTCFKPQNLQATLTPGNGTVATLTWERNANGTEDAWVLEYGTASDFTGATSVNVTGGTPSHDLTGLTAETTYYARVKPDCDTEGTKWSDAISFTPTNAYSITVNDGTNTNGYIPVYGYYVDGSIVSQFIMPAESLTAMQWGTISKLTFYASTASAGWANAQFEVYMTKVDYTTFSSTTLVDWTTMNKVMNAAHLEISGNQMVVTLDAPYQYMGGNLLIGVKQTTSGTWGSCSWYGVNATGASLGGNNSGSQQNFLPKTTFEFTPGEEPDCYITGLAVSYTGGTEATISWTSEATAWNIDVNGTVTAITENPYTLTGLELATNYEVKVQADCGDSQSDWTNASFTTDICMPENQCEITFELTDSYGDGWNGAYIAVVDVATGTELAQMTNEDLNGTSGSGENELNTKTLAVCDGREITFEWHAGSYDDEASYVVYDINGEVIFSGSGAMSTPKNYTVSCTITNCKKPTNVAASQVGPRSAVLSWTENGEATAWVVAYKEATATDFTEVNASTNPFTLEGLTPETAYTVKVKPECDLEKWSDETGFTTTVACPAPTGFAASNITAHTADLAWTGFSESYTVQYRTAAGVNGSTLNENFNSLTTNNSIPENWDNSEGTTTTDSYKWSYNTSTSGNGATNGTSHDGSKCVRYNSYNASSGQTNFLKTPAVDFPAGKTMVLSFWYKNPAGGDFSVFISTDGGTTKTALKEGMTYQTSWKQETITLTDYVGASNVTIHFKATSNWGSGDAYIYLDDVVVGEEVPAGAWQNAVVEGTTANLSGLLAETKYEATVQGDCGTDGTSAVVSTTFTTDIACPAPTALSYANVKSTSVDLSWTTGGAEDWIVAYKKDGDTEFTEEQVSTAQVTISGTTVTYTLTALLEETTYTVKVADNCEASIHGDGQSAWTAETSFTTMATCSVANVSISDVTHYTATINWDGESNKGFTVKYREAERIDGLNEEFGTSTPEGWSMYSGMLTASGDSYTATLSSSSSNWSFGTWNFTDGTTNTPVLTGDHARVNIYSNYQKWLVTPKLTVNSNTLSFDIALTNYYSNTNTYPEPVYTGSDDKFMVLVSTDNMATWNILREWNNEDGAQYVYNNINHTATGESVSISMSNYVGQEVYIAFYGESTSTNADNYIHIDNVACGNIIPATAWETVTTDETTANLNELTAGIKYDLTVVPNCDETLASEIQQFTTLADNVKIFVTEGDWNEAGNWMDGLTPTLNDNAQLQANATITGLATAGNVTIASGKTLTIADGGQLQHNNSSSITATVKKNVTGYSADNANTNNGYVLLAPPFGKTIYQNNTDGTGLRNGTYDLYSWARTNALEWTNYGSSNSSYLYMSRGTGYLYANQEDTEITFAGSIYGSGSSYSASVSYTEPTAGSTDFSDWNLLGNPFVCNAYLVDAATNGNALAFYKMNAAGNRFEATTGTAIAPMEGVFYQATEAGNVYFTREMSATSTQPGTLNINLAQAVTNRGEKGATDNAIIRFGEGNTLGKFSFNENCAKVYIPQNGKDYAVVNAEGQTGEMPVSFKAEKNGSYTLSFTSQEVSFSYLHLIDNMTGNDVDLLKTPSYTFDATTTDYAQRFRLVFATGSSVNNDNFGFVNAMGNLCIFGIEGEATLQVIDVTGRVIISNQFSGSYESKLNVAPGVYMLRLINGNDVKVQKIVME